jgi:hypothetical protein
MSLWNRRAFLRTSAQAATLAALPVPAAAAKTFPAGFFWGASTSAVQIHPASTKKKTAPWRQRSHIPTTFESAIKR